MPTILSRYATPLMTGLFIVSLVSGVALFFHVGSAWFHSMHEILSMVLIAPFVLHLWKNWRPFLNYFKRRPMALSLAASTAAALVFVVPVMTAASSGAPGGRPEFALLRAMQNAPLDTVAPIFGQDGNGLAEQLRAGGFMVASTTDTLDGIAKASGKSTTEIAAVLAAPRAE